jgi:hypothetical protein
MKFSWIRVILGVAGLTLGLLALSMMFPVLRAGLVGAYSRWEKMRGRAELFRPAPRLHVRPQDYVRFPRKGFGFVYECSDGSRVDTFKGIVTKDLVALRDSTIPLDLTQAEMDTVYEKFIEIRFFDLPEPHPPYAGIGMMPNFDIRFSATAGCVTRTLAWNTGRVVGRRVPGPEWKRLGELEDLIWRMVARHAEYRALPEPKGAYQ